MIRLQKNRNGNIIRKQNISPTNKVKWEIF